MATSYVGINLHVVFSTKHRQPMINPAWRDDLHAYIGGTIRGLGAHSKIVGGVEDHVHLLVGLKATHCPADFVRDVKKASSTWAAAKASSFQWQTGYGAFSITAADVARLTMYVANQEEPHKHISSADELRALLEEAGIPWDERYFE